MQIVINSIQKTSREMDRERKRKVKAAGVIGLFAPTKKKQKVRKGHKTKNMPKKSKR